MACRRFWSGKIVPVHHLYIHFPFCRSKCNYCAFYSVPITETLFDAYCKALKEELRFLVGSYDLGRIKTIYFGGGTPGLKPDFFPWFDSVAASLSVDVTGCDEYTIECNPLFITSSWIEKVKTSGCSRISMGIQSFTPEALQFAGRTGQSELIVESALELLEKAGFTINIDLINGLPLQDPSYDLGQVQKLLENFSSIKHLSCYDLYLESESSFGKDNISPSEETIVHEYERKLTDMLTKQGFSRYEVANFSKDRADSLHNKAYWHYKNYLGLGPAAHSTVCGRRIENSPSLEQYISGEYKTVSSLSRLEQIEEYLLMGLRLTEGIDTDDFKNRFGSELTSLCPKTITMYCEQNKMVYKTAGEVRYLAVTPEGMNILNSVLAELFFELDNQM